MVVGDQNRKLCATSAQKFRNPSHRHWRTSLYKCKSHYAFCRFPAQRFACLISRGGELGHRAGQSHSNVPGGIKDANPQARPTLLGDPKKRPPNLDPSRLSVGADGEDDASADGDRTFHSSAGRVLALFAASAKCLAARSSGMHLEHNAL